MKNAPEIISSPKSAEIISLPQSAQIKDLIEQFLANQQVRPVSKGLYRVMLCKYLNWVYHSKRFLNKIEFSDLLSYKEYLIKDSGLGLSSVSTCIVILRCFYEYLESAGHYRNVAKSLKPPRIKKGFKKLGLTKDQIISLLQWTQKNQSKRDNAIIHCLVYLGIRLIEAVRANVGDISLRFGERVLIVQGKGHDEKDDFVVMIDDCFLVVKEYLDERGAWNENDPLFVSSSNNNRGGRLTTRTLMNIASEALDGIGIVGKEYSAHSLRHSCAQNILDAGGSLENAQWVMRHKSTSTTQIYVDSIKDRRRVENAPEKLLQGFFKK